MNPQAKLSICLFSDANFFAVNILENLLSKNCIVNVVSKDTNAWKERTSQLATNNNLNIVERKNFDVSRRYDYAIFCGGFVNCNAAYTDYVDFSLLPNLAQAKKLVLFPFEVFGKNQLDKLKLSNNSAIIFIGDLLGPRIDLESSLLIARSLSDILWKRKLSLPVGETFFPIFVADAVKVIIKWLFSFGPYGKVVFLLGSQVSSDTFWMDNKKFFADLDLKYNQKLSARTVPKDIERENIGSNLGYCLNETYGWLRSNWSRNTQPPTRKKEIETVVIKKKKFAHPKAKSIFAVSVLLLAFPFITLLLSLCISFIAYKSFLFDRDNLAQNSFLLARTFAVFSEKGSNLLGYIPGVGLIYKETEFGGVLAEQSSIIGGDAIPIIRNSAQLLENVLGNQVYNPVEESQKIESEVGLLYGDLITTKSLTDNAAGRNVILARKILAKIDFERFIKLASEGRILVDNLPQLLGQGQSKTYLVLFENNMELRPTGGFIGSFGLVTFDSGRLSDLTVNDVYSADGQLNGHVEPPAPIKNYLGEANWWLRDSNWDPDFPTSAKRAEWFLDKELSKQVDGVVAVDLFPIKDILKYTGPIFLSDYNLDITSDNLYEKTQGEVDNNFFPGTHNKASFLTALSRNLLTEIVKLGVNQKLNILKTLYNSLDGRHVQIYLHDSISQETFSALGWDGAVTLPTCGTSCYADLTGVVEANVGDNKANYFIQRNINLDVAIGANEINHKLTLSLINTANPALGPSGRYKVYVRILMPTDTSAVSVSSYNGNSQEILVPELTEVKGHKEAGVLIELLAGGSKSIVFLWDSGAGGSSTLTNYGLYIRKQAGIDINPIDINIGGNGINFDPDARFALTKDGSYSYNTTLARDMFLHFSW
jgi:hypothetical protein